MKSTLKHFVSVVASFVFLMVLTFNIIEGLYFAW